MKSKLFDQILKESQENYPVISYYQEITEILEKIAQKIQEYVSNNLYESESYNKLERIREAEERISAGQRILDIINSYFNNLRKRLYDWGKITLGLETKKDSIIINGFTYTTDINSQNVFRIRDNVRTNNMPIHQQTDDTEKNRIENLCDNYFDNLKELDDLMKPYIKQDTSIKRVWPFKFTDNPTKRMKILRWIQQLLDKLGT
jgi:transcription termination factor NusB